MSWDEVVEVSPAGPFSNRSWLKRWKRLGKVLTGITLHNQKKKQKEKKKNRSRQQHAKDEFVPSSPLVEKLINQTEQKRILNIVLHCSKLQAAVSPRTRMTPN